MDNSISPIYLMELIESIEATLWGSFKANKYDNVRYYIEKWHETDNNWSNISENFRIYENTNEHINLPKTLHNIGGETLLKIAIDLGIETPDFIPSIPTFKNVLKDSYKSAFDGFNKAILNITDHPDLAIGLANSTLESILKEIIKEGKILVTYDERATLYKLTETVLKGLNMFPNLKIPPEIKNIGSSLMNINQNIEALRSSKTSMHGKASEEYIIDDPLYAYFILNSVSTLGLFIDSFYKKRFTIELENTEIIKDPLDELPF